MMKKTPAITLFFLMLVSWDNYTYAEEPEHSTLRVMTYNACRGGTYLGQALSQSAKMIKLAKADIVGLQEIGENISKLAKLLGWNHWGSFLSRYEIVDHAQGMGKRPWYGIKANYHRVNMPMPSTLTYQTHPIRPTSYWASKAAIELTPKSIPKKKRLPGQRKRVENTSTAS